MFSFLTENSWKRFIISLDEIKIDINTKYFQQKVDNFCRKKSTFFSSGQKTESFKSSHLAEEEEV